MPDRTTRQSTLRKRAGILDAARELFLRDGYERTSVDAIASLADVSKRTVYDHFGDKRSVYLAVVERETAETMAAVTRAIDEELGGPTPPAEALLSFARRIATGVLPSSPYVTLRRLTALGVENTRRADDAPPPDPEELLGARLARYAADGLLSVDKPRRAAEHFSALTFLLALDATDQGRGTASAEVVDEVLVDGVAAFMRAYGTGS